MHRNQTRRRPEISVKLAQCSCLALTIAHCTGGVSSALLVYSIPHLADSLTITRKRRVHTELGQRLVSVIRDGLQSLGKGHVLEETPRLEAGE